MAAIAMMALALFSCKKKDEPKTEAVLRICINDAELRALGDKYNQGDQTTCETDVKITLDNGDEITLEGQDLIDAKNLNKGYKKDINFVVNTVSLTANGVIDNTTNITSLQGKNLKTEIALAAPATPVKVSTDGDKTVYTVTLEPKPAVARLEVAGKIEPVKNETTQKSAFESITVEKVYVNNYLSTIAGDRHMNVTNGKDGFAAATEAAMEDEIPAAKKDAFEKMNEVAGYYLFPKKAKETATAPEYFDHVVLKIKIAYTQEALKADPTLAQKTDRYVTIARFMKDATGDLDAKGFEAGVIYKLDLNELSKDFKTGDNGLPDPNNPDTPDPEPNQKKQLIVKVKPYEWKAVNIKPDINNGYKK